MSDEPQTFISEKSYLVADCGQTLTKLALFEVVSGSYRLIAHTSTITTAGEPWLDVRIGIQNGIRHLSEITGRQFLDDRGELIRPFNRNGSGVDYFTTVVSCAPRLRTLLAGLFKHVSLSQAQHVMLTNYTDVIDVFSLSDTRKKGEQISAIVQNRPDLILITGGTNDGARDRLLELVDTVAVGVEETDSDWRPTVIFAGNEGVHEDVETRFDSANELRLTSNLQPDLGQEKLDDAIELVNEMYRVLKINQLPGIREVNDWSPSPATSTANAFSNIVNFIAKSKEQRIMAVDLGSGSLSMVYASPDEKRTAVNPNIGLGRPLTDLLGTVSTQDINRWLPSSIDEQEIVDFIYQKALHPQTVATLEKEILLEQAISRELIREGLHEALGVWGLSKRKQQTPQVDSIIIRGSIFSHAPRFGPAVLTVLDSLQPSGIFSISVDKYDILPALGKLASIDPLVVVQSLENGMLPHLAWVIAPTGSGKPGQKVMTITVESGTPKLPDVEVEYGTIELLPLPKGKPAKVTIKPARRFDIGAGPGRSHTLTIYGGLFGLVIDARGRPLTRPQKENEQHSQMRQWLRDVGG